MSKNLNIFVQTLYPDCAMNYRNLGLFILSILLLSCSPGTQLTLNSSFKDTRATNMKVIVPNNDLIDAYQIKEGRVAYTVGGKNGEIVYVQTIDKAFTVGGLRVGDPLPKAFADREIGYRLGWGYYVEIEAGWYAGFDHTTRPTEGSRIQWFFKYAF